MKVFKFLALFFICTCITFAYTVCNNANKQSDFKASPRDTVFTSAMVAFDVLHNIYKPVTVMKVFYDTTKINPKDSTRVIHFRDSMYIMQFSATDKDSTGRFIYDSIGVPKKKMYWQKLPQATVLDDYNRDWPLTLGEN